LFKQVLSRFDQAHAKLKARDKLLESFRHYYDKKEKLKEANQLKMKDISQRDPSKEAKEIEAQAKVFPFSNLISYRMIRSMKSAIRNLIL